MGFKQIDLQLDRSMTAAAHARRAVRSLEELLPVDLFWNTVLLVSELVANSVRHAGALGEGAVHVTVRAWDRRVRVEVRDSGPGFSPNGGAPEPIGTSGRGLFLVDQLADSWGVDRVDGTCVWFELAA